MYKLEPLSAEAEKFLQELQERVNNEPDKRSKYVLASKLFSNKKNRAFFEIKSRLEQASPPGRSCFYCERDRYRDIEHIKPKRHYPEHCFDWSNYVYVCTICNQDAKGDKFAIVKSDGQLVAFDRSWPDDRPLPAGEHAFIDIRSENPFSFLMLDLDTGRLVPISHENVSRQRAKYTRDLLSLDSDDLTRIRRQARIAYSEYLLRYSNAKANGNTATALRILKEILELPHPTVLVEMLRQRDLHSWIPRLVDSLPNDFRWRDATLLSVVDSSC